MVEPLKQLSSFVDEIYIYGIEVRTTQLEKALRKYYKFTNKVYYFSENPDLIDYDSDGKRFVIIDKDDGGHGILVNELRRIFQNFSN